MPEVFISYAGSDRDQARRLLSELQNLKVHGWMDQTDLTGGGAVASSIRDALRHANAVVVLLSPTSLKSQWVNFELGAAEALGKIIIPVLIEGDLDVPELLKAWPWVDARHKAPGEVAREIEQMVAAA
jgi:TIR domain